MKVFVNYPTTDEGKKLFQDNLAIFKARLMLKSIENLKISDIAKEKMINKVLEILKSMTNNVDV